MKYEKKRTETNEENGDKNGILRCFRYLLFKQTTTMKTARIQSLFAATMVAAILSLNVTVIAQPDTEAQPVPPPSATPQRSAADLEKLAAPMALYPDPLVAVMLPAAAYPVEIVQAARFVANTNNLATLDEQPWDDNVKAVARFPSVIQNMSDELSWTAELGQAFVQQPSELMEAIQTLRAKAQSVGTLQSTPQQVVIVTNAVVERMYETQIVYVTNTVVQIVPASPQVVYVPVYNPVVVYAPPPTYIYSPATPLIVFGAGIACGIIIANNHCDWHYGGVYYGRSTVVVYHGSGYGRYPYYPPPPHYRPPPYYPPPGYRPPPPGYRPPGYPPPSYHPGRPDFLSGPSRWSVHRTTLAARSKPNGGQRRSQGTAQRQHDGSTRLEFRGLRNRNPPGSRHRHRSNSSRNRDRRPTASPWPATAAQRPAQSSSAWSQPRPANNTPAQTPNVTRPTPSRGNAQPVSNPSVNRPEPSSAGQRSAFDGVNNGAAARDSSSRGASSRGSNQSSRGGNARGGRQ